MLYVRNDFITNFQKQDWEPGFPAYTTNLIELNKIIRSFDTTKMEGNLFYKQYPEQIEDQPDRTFINKRRNFALYVSLGTKLLEIGFNAGHSCLLALTVNPKLRYVGVDLGAHPYTRPCFEYLRSVFGDRVELLLSDSRDAVPHLGLDGDFDLYHIDGGHGFDLARTDLINVLHMCKTNQVILFDDVGAYHLDALIDIFSAKGMVSRVPLNRLWAGNLQVLLRCHK